MAFHHTRKTSSGVYHYRQALPKALQRAFGKTELVLSLYTKNPAEARLRASMVCFLVAKGLLMPDLKKIIDGFNSGEVKPFEIGMDNGIPFIKQATSKEDRDMALEEIARINENKILVPAQTHQPHAPASLTVSSAITLSQALIHYKQHRKSRGQNTNQETEKERLKTLDNFETWHLDYCKKIFTNRASDFPLAEITKLHITAYRTSLEKKGLSRKTIAKIGSYLNQFFRQCQDDGLFPITNILPTDKQFKFTAQDKKNASTRGFQPFDLSQLQKIFDLLPLDKPHQHLAPLIALFTGARRQEIAGLSVDDLQVVGDLFCIHLPGTKTDSSDRTIPLHPMLVHMGFVEYVEDVKKLGLPNKRLFPYLPFIKGQYGKKLSDDFSAFIKEIGLSVATGKLGLHSFRDTFNNALIDNGIEEQKRCEILGQKFESVNKDNYGKIYKMQILRPFVHGVKFDLKLDRVVYKEQQYNEYLIEMNKDGRIK